MVLDAVRFADDADDGFESVAVDDAVGQTKVRTFQWQPLQLQLQRRNCLNH